MVSGLSGYGIGRATAGNKLVASNDAADDASTEIIGGADEATSIVLEDGMQHEDAAQTDTEAAAEETTEAQESTENTDTESGSSEIVDAADITDVSQIASGSGNSKYDNINVGAYSDTTEMEYTEVDPAYVANVTLREADLPDGVASTLYSKRTGEDAAMQVVVMGDSQFANFLGTDGMAYKLSEKCQANVYNLAIGGTSAAISSQDVDDNGRFDDTGLCGIVKAICGDVDADRIFNGYTYQYNVFKSCDFSKTDVFVLEYGVNDYFMKVPLFEDANYVSDKDDDNYGYNIYTYNGALKYAILALRTHFPDAAVYVCAPTYAEFFQSGTGYLLGNYYSVSNGIGTLEQYVEAAQNVPSDFYHTATFVPENDMDTKMDYYNADEYLLDGVHLTEKAREEYTQILGRFLIREMGYEIPEDTNPSDYDWRSTKQ